MWFCFFAASVQCVSNGSLFAKNALCSEIFHSICFSPSTLPSTPFSQHYSSLRTNWGYPSYNTVQGIYFKIGVSYAILH